jgi:hypothetical protein
MNSSPEEKDSIFPAARSASASRSPACHSGDQNHACVASTSFCGRSKMPSAVSSASRRSPSSRRAALRMSSGSVSCPLARSVVLAIERILQSDVPTFHSSHRSRPRSQIQPIVVGRYYDPQTGQFLTVDPLVDTTGQAYAYVAGDPVNGQDPNGEGPEFPNICASNSCRGAASVSWVAVAETVAPMVAGGLGSLSAFVCGPCAIPISAVAAGTSSYLVHRYLGRQSVSASARAATVDAIFAGAMEGVGNLSEVISKAFEEPIFPLFSNPSPVLRAPIVVRRVKKASAIYRAAHAHG